MDKNQKLAARYGVSSIPVFLIFNQGKIIARHVGITPEATLRAELDEIRAAGDSTPARMAAAPLLRLRAARATAHGVCLHLAALDCIGRSRLLTCHKCGEKAPIIS